MEKICNKCGISKELEMFPKDKGIKCGRISICKECNNKIVNERRKNNRESYDLKAEKYRELHKEKVCNKCGINKGLDMFANARMNKDGKHNTCRKCDGKRRNNQYYDNREHHIAKVKEYYNNNKDYYKVQSKIYREDNKKKLNEYDKFRYKNTMRGAVQVFNKRIKWCVFKDKQKEISKKCRIKYIDKYRAMEREWYKNNKEHVKDYMRSYREKNPEKCGEWSSRRSAIKKDCIPSWYIKEICDVFYWMSRKFTEIFGIQYSVDHIIPLNFGGPHSHENLRVMPRGENSSKMDKVDEYLFNFVISYYNY